MTNSNKQADYNRYAEAANWFIRIESGQCSQLEIARFKGWLNFSQGNRKNFDQVGLIWDGAPSAAYLRDRGADKPATRFFSYSNDTWRDAVFPAALVWPRRRQDSVGVGHHPYAFPAAAPSMLL